MDPDAEQLIMYGKPSEVGALEWAWVDDQLKTVGAYWMVAPGRGHPHPRPVWGVWTAATLYLSIGSPRINADLQGTQPVSVHLGSATDVVILEGMTAGSTDDSDVLSGYNAKYDWNYTIGEYGPFTKIVPSKVMAWRSAGWAGRGGFQQTGRWRFPSRTS